MSNRTVTIAQAASILRTKPRWLYAALRFWDLTNKANLPSDLMIAKGLMEIAHYTYYDNKGNKRHKAKAVITKQGLTYIDGLIESKAPKAVRQRDSSSANESRENTNAQNSSRAPTRTNQKAC